MSMIGSAKGFLEKRGESVSKRMVHMSVGKKKMLKYGGGAIGAGLAANMMFGPPNGNSRRARQSSGATGSLRSRSSGGYA